MNQTRLRIVTILIISSLIIVGGATAVRAGKIEADVIAAAWINGVEAFEAGEDLEPAIFDAVDIFADTASGSYCETYAASVAFSLITLERFSEEDPEDERTIYDAIDAVVLESIVFPESTAVANRCLNEM